MLKPEYMITPDDDYHSFILKSRDMVLSLGAHCRRNEQAHEILVIIFAALKPAFILAFLVHIYLLRHNKNHFNQMFVHTSSLDYKVPSKVAKKLALHKFANLDEVNKADEVDLKVFVNQDRNFFINGRVTHSYDDDWTADLPTQVKKKNLARYEVPTNII